jgi:NhaP-type Na+/H+ and K+/H+ antiporter
MLVGPGAFVLGGVGGFFTQSMSARVRTSKNLVLQTTGVGLLLGGAVPALANFMWGGWNKNFAIGLVPLGAITGLICAAAQYWLLQRMHLLDFQQSRNSKLV